MIAYIIANYGHRIALGELGVWFVIAACLIVTMMWHR